MEINQPQKIQFERLRLGSFNSFDGDKVADGLLKHRNLWDSFVFGRFRYGTLIELRDLPQGELNADTIMILTDLKRAKEIIAIALKQWNVDETGYCGRVEGEYFLEGDAPCNSEKELFQEMGGLGNNQIVVRLWWD
jgi:hypothetical protein